MQKNIKKSLVFIFVICFSLLLNNTYKVKALDNISTVGDNVASYCVENIIEEETLDFGVKYHNDQGYSYVSDTNYVLGCEAGNASYGANDIEKNKKYSQNVNILEIPTNSPVSVIPYANIKVGTWTLTTVKSLISKYESANLGKKVIAAINGDFFDNTKAYNYINTTIGGTVSDGNYYKVSYDRNCVGFKNDGSNKSVIGNVVPTVSSKPILEVFNENNEVIYKINVDNINKIPLENETSCYFDFYDSNHKPIKQNVKNAYFVTGDEIVPFSENSVFGKGQITKYGDGEININQFGIITNNQTLKSYLKTGTTIRVQYVYTGELEGIDNVCGYGGNIIVNNETVLNSDYRHPRTMIGMKEDGTIIMSIVDGRQISKGYYGVSPVEQAAMMQYYGCVNAYNLDGGGSTTMVILEDGEYVIKNSPSDGSPRSDGNCLLVVADVPIIRYDFNEITKISFVFNIEIIKMIDEYKKLYIKIIDDDEEIYKEIVDGKVYFTGLSPNTEYKYKIYAKIDNEYFGLPFSGIIETSKSEFEIDKVCISETILNNVSYYQIDCLFFDDDKTIVSVDISINGKKYYMNDDKKINIVKENGLSNSYLLLSVVYDLNNHEGRKKMTFDSFSIQYEYAYILLDSITNDVSNWFDIIIK